MPTGLVDQEEDVKFTLRFIGQGMTNKGGDSVIPFEREL